MIDNSFIKKKVVPLTYDFIIFNNLKSYFIIYDFIHLHNLFLNLSTMVILIKNYVDRGSYFTYK